MTPELGLTDAAAAESRARHGANILTPLPRAPLWHKFLEKFDEPIIKILLAAALLSMIVDLVKANAILGGLALAIVVGALVSSIVLGHGRWVPTLMFTAALALFGLGLAEGHVLIEGLAVMLAVILATGVAFLSEYKSDREFEILNARKESIQVKVLRAGQMRSLPAEDVVVGDLLTLETGDEIPADGRVLRATGFMVDQSLMTGESEPSRKTIGTDEPMSPDQPSCLYRGTHVVDGVGLMLVTAVGDGTYLGAIARRLSADDDEEAGAEQRVKRRLTVSKELTPLQEKLQRLAEVISRVGYVAALLIFAAQLVRGILVGEVFIPATSTQFLDVLGELLGYFVTMVIIIVVAVPEGLPMSVTISLALAMQKMTRANSLVRQLVACETIGSATVICSDKTGTLTQNRMQVERIYLGDTAHERGSPGWPALVASLPTRGSAAHWLTLNAVCNSTANLEEKEGRLVTLGNSTEGALLHWTSAAGVDYRQYRQQWTVAHQVPFSSERKRMTTVVRLGAEIVMLVKGAPEWVLERCDWYVAADGTEAPLTAERREAVGAELRGAAGLAMRTLAFAHRTLSDYDSASEPALVFAGFVAIRDPLRPEVNGAIEQCRRAGIDVKMITGDNVETARAIAYEMGLVARPDEAIDTPAAVVLTSPYLNGLSDDDLRARLPRLRVLARAQPLDKFRLVRLLQDLGEVVAVTGDGTNDAPALKKADVGLAMGIAGTEVAKEASKIVLLDDSFATIVKAVHWGRSLYENIQRFIQFQLTINISALAITFLGILIFQVKAPFTVLQLLWINVIMDTLASIALCSEPPRPGVMRQPPKRRDESILTSAMLWNIGLTATFFVIVMLGLLVALRGDPRHPGLLAGPGPWSVEVAGNRIAVPVEDLGSDGAKWYREEDGRRVEVLVDFTVFQVSLFFSIYVFFQVWNQINARALTPETSGFSRLHRNPTFLAIAAIVALGQVAIITFGGRVFKVQPLDATVWVGVIVFTASVLVFAEIARRLRLALGSRSR